LTGRWRLLDWLLDHSLACKLLHCDGEVPPQFGSERICQSNQI